MKEKTDREILLIINERLENHLNSFTEHKKEFSEHLIDDKKSFSFLNKSVYLGMGALAVVQFIIMKMLK